MYNLEEIFELEMVDYDKVVIKVNADTPLKVAMFPFVSGNDAYITVTRGRNHILTVINKNGNTCSFHWGDSGYTLISDELEELKHQVLRFIDSCGILLEYKGGNVTDVSVFYNRNFKAWQLTLRTSTGDVFYRDYNAESFDDMFDRCGRFMSVYNWGHSIAETGIDVWKPVIKEYKLK